MFSLPDVILPKREFFGLSIDPIAVRGIQIDRNGKMTSIAEVIFPGEIFQHSDLVGGEIFSSSLKKLKEIGKFTTPYVVVTFPEAFAYTRELRLPVVSIAEIAEAVKWHAKELFPFPEDEIYVDWRLLKSTSTEHILAVVATPKRTIDPLVNTLLSIGLKPLSIRPDASAITSLLHLKEQQHAIVTEINRTVAYVTLVEGEKSIFTTVVSFTKEDTPTTYLHNISNTIGEIQNYYHEKGVLSEGVVDIVLTGEVANEQLMKQLPSPAKLLVTPTNSPSFNKAYAVAVSQLSPTLHSLSINLLPQAMQETYANERRVEYYNAILFRTVSAIGAYSVVALLILGIMMMYRQELDGQVKRLTTVLENSQQSSQNLLRVNGTAKQIVALAPLKRTQQKKLNTIFTAIPQGVTLTQWEYDDAKLQFTITGIARTRDDLLLLRDNIEKTNEFSKIAVPLSFLEAPTNINFSISFVSK